MKISKLGRAKNPQKRRKRGDKDSSKIINATISIEYYARFLQLAGNRSFGLTIQELIDSANPTYSENSLHNPTD